MSFIIFHFATIDKRKKICIFMDIITKFDRHCRRAVTSINFMALFCYRAKGLFTAHVSCTKWHRPTAIQAGAQSGSQQPCIQSQGDDIPNTDVSVSRIY